MQEENKGKHVAKHARPDPVQEPAPEKEHAKSTGSLDAAPQPAVRPEVSADDSVWEEDLIGNEDEVPIRKKPSKSTSGKPAARKKKSRAPRTGRPNRRQEKEPDTFSERRFRTRRSLFEIMSGTGDEGMFKPIAIFGREIRFRPIFLLIVVVLLAGVLVISNGNVTVLNESVTLVGLHDDLEDYKILVISDLNGKRFGDEQSSLLREIEALDYDIILCLGDMVGKSGDPEPFWEFLDGLSKPEKVYFIQGDSDPGPFVETARDLEEGTLSEYVLEEWILGAIERGANYVDAPVSIEVGETRIWLTPTSMMNIEIVSYLEDWRSQEEQEEEGTLSGLTTDYNSVPFTSYRRQQAEKLYSAYNSMYSTDLVIGLSHQVPSDDFIKSAATHTTEEGKFIISPNLIVAGHNCGGVWQIPLIDTTLYVPNKLLKNHGWLPDKEDISGLSTVGSSQVYITGGLCTTSSVPVLPFRLFNPPEVTVLTLTAKLQDNLFTSE